MMTLRATPFGTPTPSGTPDDAMMTPGVSVRASGAHFESKSSESVMGLLFDDESNESRLVLTNREYGTYALRSILLLIVLGPAL